MSQIDVRETPAGLEVVKAEQVVEWSTILLAGANDHIEITAGRIKLFALNGTWTYVICAFLDEGRRVTSLLESVTESEITGAIPLPVRN